MEKQQPTFQVSYFHNTGCKTPVLISLEKFIAAVKGGSWEKEFRAYHTLLEQGRAEQAAKVKNGLPGITAAGIFEGGHKASGLKQLSGLLCLDIDKYEGDMEELRCRCLREPSTVATFVSISGKGLKVVVRIYIDTPAAYRETYYRVMAHYNRAAGVECDKQCCDLPRLTFASFDPHATYRPEALPFTPAPVPEALSRFFDRFEQHSPLLPGSRHSNLLRLSKAAAQAGFPYAEVLEESLRRYRSEEFPAGEIERVSTGGYRYAEQQTGAENGPFRATLGPGAINGPKNEKEEPEAAFESDEALRSQAPSIPDEIFDNLPIMIQKALLPARDNRQRDMLLMGVLAILSGCLPHIKLVYSRKSYSPHFYFFGVAHAGTGKGIVELAHLLAEPLHQHYEKKSEEQVKIYNNQLFEWERKIKKVTRTGEAVDLSDKPEEPPPSACLSRPTPPKRATCSTCGTTATWAGLSTAAKQTSSPPPFPRTMENTGISCAMLSTTKPSGPPTK